MNVCPVNANIDLRRACRYSTAGPSEDILLEKIEYYEEIVAKYSGIRNHAAETGVERAREAIHDTQAALSTLRAANAKVAIISAEFDARAFEVRLVLLVVVQVSRSRIHSISTLIPNTSLCADGRGC